MEKKVFEAGVEVVDDTEWEIPQKSCYNPALQWNVAVENAVESGWRGPVECYVSQESFSASFLHNQSLLDKAGGANSNFLVWALSSEDLGADL